MGSSLPIPCGQSFFALQTIRAVRFYFERHFVQEGKQTIAALRARMESLFASEGVRLALRTTHNLAEGAGASTIAAAMKLRDQLAGTIVVCVMSGGNIDQATLRRILG